MLNIKIDLQQRKQSGILHFLSTHDSDLVSNLGTFASLSSLSKE